MFNNYHPQDYDNRPNSPSSERRERHSWPLGHRREAGSRWQLRFHLVRKQEQELLQEFFPYGDPLEWENGENPDEQFTFF